MFSFFAEVVIVIEKISVIFKEVFGNGLLWLRGRGRDFFDEFWDGFEFIIEGCWIRFGCSFCWWGVRYENFLGLFETWPRRVVVRSSWNRTKSTRLRTFLFVQTRWIGWKGVLPLLGFARWLVLCRRGSEIFRRGRSFNRVVRVGQQVYDLVVGSGYQFGKGWVGWRMTVGCCS